ncbi:MAG: hypothetical protein AB7E08_06030 [Candidatus Omnitrophota bacterium]
MLTYQYDKFLTLLRKRLKDYISTDYAWTDDDLKDYIEDGLSEVEKYIGSITIVETLVNNQVVREFSVPLTTIQKNLLMLQTLILIIESTKVSADRDNFSITKGRLRIDNTGQSSDHMDTLGYLNTKLINYIYNNFHEGARIE